jgi:NAD+ kinase
MTGGHHTAGNGEQVGEQTSEPKRNVLLVTHTGRAEAKKAARKVAHWLSEAGIGVRVLSGDVDGIEFGATATVLTDPALAVSDCELVVVLGGDGTLLRGAALARQADVPLLGVNFGRVGFLAEAELADLHEVVERISDQRYAVEERMTLDIEITAGGEVFDRAWALNEVTVEKRSWGRMVEVMVEIDGRPLSRWGCDGVVCATPTGSTAYAFSAGGPVVWPEVEALLLVPISAHALFARPLVVGPSSVVRIEVLDDTGRGQEQGQEDGVGSGVLSCDGHRIIELPPGASFEVRRGTRPVRLARLRDAPFTDRLVAKFALPVHGWLTR